MIDEINEEFNDPEDLAIAIDERLQISKTAAKIVAVQLTANSLAKLLIAKGIFTSNEFIELIETKAQKLNEGINTAKDNQPDLSLTAIADVERFLATFTEEINVVCEKLAAHDEPNR